MEPENPTLVVELPLSKQSVKFHCIERETGDVVVGGKFTLGSLNLGTITDDGVFTPSGLAAGQVHVKCEKNGLAAHTTLRIRIHAVDTEPGLTPDQLAALRMPGGSVDEQFRFLYPYDYTVFPGGIIAPEIHLTEGKAPGEAFYAHILATEFEYEGFFHGPSKTPQLAMSQPAWDALTASAGGTKVEVHVSKLASGKKYGPIFRTWILAPGKLHGTIYYNTYDSTLAQQTGAIMRIKPGAPGPEVVLGGCTVCHSVSADGSTLAAANNVGSYSGGTYDLTGDMTTPTSLWQDPMVSAFAALYPKGGEVLVTNAAPSNYWPPNIPGVSIGPFASELRTKAGTVVPMSGIEGYYAQTPAFSHDGTMLVFTDRQAVAPYSSVLASLQFDSLSRKFSNYDVIAVPKSDHNLSWPSFTPDSRYVLYQDGKSADLATWSETTSDNEGTILASDRETMDALPLLRMNGDGSMPAGGRDERKNFIPTVAPVASGGYFWVMFTSRRTYGNKLTGPAETTKRLWIAAFDIDPPAGADPSHPAFYLAGQELGSGNTRGFWVLDPCRKDGDACETGDQCCGGRCDPKGIPPELRCGPPDGTCSDEFEICVEDEDCCAGSSLDCIGGKCAMRPPR